jgi:hypothetical protein
MQSTLVVQPQGTTAQNEERARDLIFQKRRTKVDEIAKQLNISIGSAYSVIYDNLYFHKVCARWVPKGLTDEHRYMPLDICSSHLACCHKEDDNFLQEIVTGDETCIAMEASVILLQRNSRRNYWQAS